MYLERLREYIAKHIFSFCFVCYFDKLLEDGGSGQKVGVICFFQQKNKITIKGRMHIFLALCPLFGEKSHTLNVFP